MRYSIKTADNKWWVDGSGYGLTRIKKERIIYSNKKLAVDYIKGTNVWGELKIHEI